ncbi:MAG: LacI family DNA-binding transcriptional regulator [candidate division NC10 bacterium]|nr:LacI family DNA-binding transcriptional regulator [candidate division NC10 bacterium]
MPKPVRAPVTLKHIARHTGLSIMTVSRVVRGRPDVSPESRRRVLAAVRRLGYIPNPAAQLLVNRTAPGARSDRIVGAIFSREVVTSHSYFAGIIQGIADEARRSDCHLLLGYGLGDATQPRDYPRMIREMMTRWLILVGKVAPRLVRQLHGTGFSLVLVDMRPPIRDADGVICDDAQGGYEATRHLIKLGHRRIALIRGPARHPFSQALTSGYRRALHEAGMPVRDGYVVEEPLRPAGGYEAAEALLKGPSRPTAIFTNDDVAIGALRAIHDRGLTVPEGVALVGYDDIEYAAHTTPPLTTVAVPKEEMGRLAVRRAIAQMEEGERHVFSTTVVSHTLLIRSSCGAGTGTRAASGAGAGRLRLPRRTGRSHP